MTVEGVQENPFARGENPGYHRPRQGRGQALAAVVGVGADAAQFGETLDPQPPPGHGDQVAVTLDADEGAQIAGLRPERTGLRQGRQGQHGRGVGLGQGLERQIPPPGRQGGRHHLHQGDAAIDGGALGQDVDHRAPRRLDETGSRMPARQLAESGKAGGRRIGGGEEDADLGVDAHGATVGVRRREWRQPCGQGVPDGAVEGVAHDRRSRAERSRVEPPDTARRPETAGAVSRARSRRSS